MVEPITLAAVSIGLQSLGMISDFVGGRKAEKAAERAAKKEAVAEYKVTAERLRQLEKQERTMAGQTRAGYAGGGVKADKGSPLMVLAEQAREFAYEKQITRQVGASRAAAALQSGRDVGQSYRYRSYSNLAKGASGIANTIAQYQFAKQSSSSSSGSYGPPT